MWTEWQTLCRLWSDCSWLLFFFGGVGWLCWGLTSLSTIFQSCRDGAIASWVINQYFRGVKCLAQGHNTAEVGLEPRTSRSGVRHSTTEPPRSPFFGGRFYGPSNLFHSFWAESIIRWGENGRSPRKTTWPPASRTWLVSRLRSHMWPAKATMFAQTNLSEQLGSPEYIWAPSQENLSSGSSSRVDTNQPAQLQKLGRDLKFWI